MKKYHGKNVKVKVRKTSWPFYFEVHWKGGKKS